jgi:hypothetical protein
MMLPRGICHSPSMPVLYSASVIGTRATATSVEHIVIRIDRLSTPLLK